MLLEEGGIYLPSSEVDGDSGLGGIGMAGHEMTTFLKTTVEMLARSFDSIL
jgi:hypothetical protein